MKQTSEINLLINFFSNIFYAQFRCDRNTQTLFKQFACLLFQTVRIRTVVHGFSGQRFIFINEFQRFFVSLPKNMI